MTGESSPLTAAWRLSRFDRGDGSLVPPLEGTELTAEFRDDGRLGGSAGCNRYMATYEATDTSLTVNPQVALTQMWCGDPEGMMDQEAAFLRAWGRVAGCEFLDDELHLSDANGATVLVFVPAEAA